MLLGHNSTSDSIVSDASARTAQGDKAQALLRTLNATSRPQGYHSLEPVECAFPEQSSDRREVTLIACACCLWRIALIGTVFAMLLVASPVFASANSEPASDTSSSAARAQGKAKYTTQTLPGLLVSHSLQSLGPYNEGTTLTRATMDDLRAFRSWLYAQITALPAPKLVTRFKARYPTANTFTAAAFKQFLRSTASLRASAVDHR